MNPPAPIERVTLPNEPWLGIAKDQERKLISIVLKFTGLAPDAVTALTPEQFTHGSYAQFFALIRDLWQERHLEPTHPNVRSFTTERFEKPEDQARIMEIYFKCFSDSSFCVPTDYQPTKAGIIERNAQAVAFGIVKEYAEKLLAAKMGGAEILADLRKKIAALSTGVALPTALPLNAFTHGTDNGGNLLGNRYLCRGGGLLVAAPTGIGKSSWSTQAAICWSLGLSHLGIVPSGKLRSLVIQSENDHGDISELRDGIYDGLKLSPEQREEVSAAITVICESTKTGSKLVDMVGALVQEHRPHLVFLDPLFAYLGDSVIEQKAVSAFLRNGLNPILQQHGCALVLIHHTNKPQAKKDKSDFKAGDFAYLGSGTAELANWARAVIAIRSIGEHDVFEMIFGKRGRRAGLIDAWGKPIYSIHIRHAKTGIFWEQGEAPVGVRKMTKDDVLNLIPATGDISQTKLFSAAAELEIGQNKARSWLKELEEDEQIFIWRTARPGTNAAKSYSRHKQSSEPQPSERDFHGDVDGKKEAVKVLSGESKRDTFTPPYSYTAGKCVSQVANVLPETFTETLPASQPLFEVDPTRS